MMGFAQEEPHWYRGEDFPLQARDLRPENRLKENSQPKKNKGHG